MDANKGKSRQTNIVDADAVARAMQGGQRKTQPKKKKNGPPNISTQQHAGVSKPRPTKKSPATASNEPRFYQKDGLKIPLYEKGGKKRTTTRLAKTLRNKGTDYLLDIVAEYAGEAKRKQFKDQDFTKAQIADWIEGAERLALPAHPQSGLPKDPNPADDYEIDANDPAWDDEPVVDHADGKRKSSAKDNGKRKRSDAPEEPAQTEQQTSKKPKTRDTRDHQVEQSHTVRKQSADQAKRDARYVQMEAPTQKPTAPTQEVEEDDQEEDDPSMTPESQASRLGQFMRDIAMHPDNLPGTSSTRVAHLAREGEDRILTASILPNGQTVMHNTPIPHNLSKPRVTLGKPAPPEPPFLKRGVHGRHGDFLADPDRRSGRGHQVSVQDWQDYEDCLSYIAQVREVHPLFPRAGEGLEIGEGLRRDWRENEEWYQGFREKYGGFAVGHVWPCGCERMEDSDGEESEEE